MKWRETEASRCRYGEVAGEIWGDADVIWEDSEADYQGHATILAKTPDGRWWFYEWWYGSCSGCDTWEAADLTDDQIREEMERSAAVFDDPDIMRRFLGEGELVVSESREAMTGGLTGGLDVLTGGTCERHKAALAAMNAYLSERFP